MNIFEAASAKKNKERQKAEKAAQKAKRDEYYSLPGLDKPPSDEDFRQASIRLSEKFKSTRFSISLVEMHAKDRATERIIPLVIIEKMIENTLSSPQYLRAFNREREKVRNTGSRNARFTWHIHSKSLGTFVCGVGSPERPPYWAPEGTNFCLIVTTVHSHKAKGGTFHPKNDDVQAVIESLSRAYSDIVIDLD